MLGSSLGGYLAQYFAANFPRIVERLIAANTLHSVDGIAARPPYSSDLDNAPIEDPMKLVKGGTDSFHAYLLEREFGQEQATAICQQLEVFAARTLFDPRCPELPSGFVAAIEKAREVSHALVD